MSARLADGSILRALGLALARDEHGTARLVAVTATPIVWRRCGWCHQVLGVIPVESVTPGLFSDTCCPACRVKFFAGVKQTAA